MTEMCVSVSLLIFTGYIGGKLNDRIVHKANHEILRKRV